MSATPSSPRVTRRGFLLGAAAGLAVGAPAAWYLGRRFGGPSRPAAVATAPSPLAMPGLYPGHVVEVRHPRAVAADHTIDASVVAQMVDRGMAELTGTPPRDVRGAWGTFFEKGDVVGIKVNPVGRKPHKGEPGRVRNAVGSISSPELLIKVVRCLVEAGVAPRDIIVFERYAREFVEAGYADFVERDLPKGVRWHAAALSYSDSQLDVRGRDPDCSSLSPEAERRVVGYDPDVFTAMGYCMPNHSPRDDRRFRSHLSLVVSRMVNKMITLPVLKDHRSAGVTLALKNLSHGMNNNVCRSHLSGIAHGVGAGGKVLGPNQCNTFIPQAVAQPRLRERATLHILDGLIAVYEGGPGSWNQTWGTWRHSGLFFATDPVAMDHVGWDIIDAKRAEHGWAPVERMGLLYQTPGTPGASAAAALGGRGLLGGMTLTAGADNILRGRASESFNMRQPDHVVLAGQLGLGVFDWDRINYRRIDLAG